MVFGGTLGVSAAKNSFTGVHTFIASDGVGKTFFCVITICVFSASHFLGANVVLTELEVWT